MKKEQIIFSEISDLNVQMTYSSSLDSYVSESSRMVAEELFKKIIKSIPENSLAYQILTSTDHYSEKQLWTITFELLKNESYCNEIMEEFYERNSREFEKRNSEKLKLQQNKENSKNILDVVKSNGKKLAEYYAFVKKNKKFRKEFYSQKFSIESVNAFLSVCDCGKPIDSRYAPCCSLKCWDKKFL